MRKRIGFVVISLLFVVCCSACSEVEEFESLFAQLESQTPEDSATKTSEIGEAQTIANLQTTITGYEFSDYAGALDGLSKAEDGYRYCVVYLDVKNIGSSALELDDYNFCLYYNTDYSYLGTWAIYTQFLYAHDSIPALGEVSNVCICFKVPEEVETNNDLPLTIELKENSILADEVAIWTLR